MIHLPELVRQRPLARPDGGAVSTHGRLDEEDLKPVAANYAYYIRLGRAGSEDVLMRALNKHGGKDMAVDYLNCGNDTLEQAAQDWAANHGYEVYTTPGVAGGPQWGEGN